MYRFEKSDYLLGLISTAILSICLFDGAIYLFDTGLYIKGSQYLDQYGFGDFFKSATFRAKPPLYSIFFNLLSNNLALVSWSNLLVHILSLGLSFHLVNLTIQDKMLRLLTKALIALGVPIILIHNLLLPDALFILTWNVHLLLVYHILTSPSQRLFLMITLTSLLMLGLRHIGIILIVSSGVYLLFYLRNSNKKVTALLSLAFPILVFGVWQYFLFKEVGNFSRLNHTGELDLQTNSYQILHHFTHWFVPSTGIRFLDFGVSIILIGCLIFLIRTSFQSSERTDYKIYFSTIIIAFLGFIMLKGDLIASDIERYIALIYLPTLLLIVPGLQSIKHRLGSKMFMIFIGIWSTYPIARLINNVILWSGF